MFQKKVANKVLNLFMKEGGLEEAKGVLKVFKRNKNLSGLEHQKADKIMAEGISLHYNMAPSIVKKMARDRIRLDKTINDKNTFEQGLLKGKRPRKDYIDWFRKHYDREIETLLKLEYNVGRGVSKTYGKPK